jgi:hypothetical protein
LRPRAFTKPRRYCQQSTTIGKASTNSNHRLASGPLVPPLHNGLPLALAVISRPSNSCPLFGTP